jgi:hypothetical protein
MQKLATAWDQQRCTQEARGEEIKPKYLVTKDVSRLKSTPRLRDNY